MAATRFGLTWWGQRWIAALEALGALYANRLPRGRTYARRGAVTDLALTAGSVSARVQGSRARPYRVTLQLPAFDDATWEAVLAELAGELRHAAVLLDGQMPPHVDDVFATCGVSLFPRPGELTTTCSCPDWANPCKHVAAVHYVLGQTFDADPFLLPSLRGRDRVEGLPEDVVHRGDVLARVRPVRARAGGRELTRPREQRHATGGEHVVHVRRHLAVEEDGGVAQLAGQLGKNRLPGRVVERGQLQRHPVRACAAALHPRADGGIRQRQVGDRTY